MTKNIIYNTTRQWNPGDEFILLGCRNILNFVLGKHNSIIFNRNPEISSPLKCKCYRDIKLPDKFWKYPEILNKKAYYKIDFLDNSIKYDSDLSYADLAVFAGTPNWGGAENMNFYEHIIKNSLPSIILGVGSMVGSESYEEEVISKSLVFTVRDKNLLNNRIAKSYGAVYLPCPAMQSVEIGKEKKIKELKTIGLGFGVDFAHSVAANSIDDKTYAYIKDLYLSLIEKYKNKYNFNIICHYIDELSVAHEIFDSYDIPILYSHDSVDYIDIYKNSDFVISTRVHGCGISSSLGIPSVCVSHDERANTCEGFLAKFVTNQTPKNNIYEIIKNAENNIEILNSELIAHKKNIFQKYVSLLSEKLNLNKIEYQSKVEYLPTQNNISSINDIEEIPTNIQKIPKNIYYVWDGDKSEFVNSCILSWKTFCPDFNIIEINKYSEFYKKAYESNIFFRFCADRNLFAPMSDVLRLMALYEYGGLYLDVDVQLVKPLTPLLNQNFLGIESNNLVNGAIMGFEKKHPLIKKVLDFFENKVMESDEFIIPCIIKDCAQELYSQNEFLENVKYEFNDLIIYQKEYFYPFYYNEKFNLNQIKKNTYSVHWWRGSWSDNKSIEILKDRKNFIEETKKNIEETKKILNINPKISVVLPTYNAEKYLKDAVDSILNQTFQDFELLVIDDNSKDNTIEILNSYKDERIKIIQGPCKGLPAALNVGLDAAQGEYIARMDADDISMPQRFERQLLVMDNNPQIDICGSFVSLLYEQTHNEVLIKNPITDADIRTCLFFVNPIAHSAIMCRKSTFDKYNIRYLPECKSAEDLELWQRIAGFVNFYNSPESLLVYRIHDESSSTFQGSQLNDALMKLCQINIKNVLGVDIDDDIISAFRPPERAKNKYSIAQIQKIVEISKLLINKLDKAPGEYNKVLFNQLIMTGIDEIVAKMQDNITKGLLV